MRPCGIRLGKRGIRHEQGVSKAGIQTRTTMIQIAWLWITSPARSQP